MRKLSMRKLTVRKPILTHPIRQLAQVAAGFVAATVLLESAGLVSWANHLDIGPLRTVAIPVTSAIEKAMHPLRIDGFRAETLATLARAGWSDDAFAVAAARQKPGGNNLQIASKGVSSVPAWLSRSRSTVPTSAAHADGTATPHAHLKSSPATEVGTGAGAALSPSVPRVSPLPPLPPVSGGKPRVVALAGDSMMAVGLSATLMREAAGHKNLHIVKAFRSGTGLARPDVFNWMDEYPAMIGAEDPDVVIVAIGANDGQGFVENGKVLPYGSQAWVGTYQRRLADYLSMVSAGGARVVWVGLPPMKVPAYNEKIAAINRIAYTVVSQNPQATWWNPVSFVGDDEGGFREFATSASGHTTRIRAVDGIHLSDEGAALLTSVLVPWLDPPDEVAADEAPAVPKAARHLPFQPQGRSAGGRKPVNSRSM
jgi:hypothetical protein